MLETLTERETFNIQIESLMDNGFNHPYPDTIFEQPHVIVREILDYQGVDKRHPLKRRIGHNFSILIAKSREKEELKELERVIKRLERDL